jgi:hypothetical protein
MNPQLTDTVQTVATKAREIAAKVRPGTAEGRRSLPIRSDPDEVRRLWADADARAAVLEGPAVRDASLTFGEVDGDWGTTVTLDLQLEEPLPGTATRLLAGKAVRRLKALAETGEVPTTAHNPSGRSNAGNGSS